MKTLKFNLTTAASPWKTKQSKAVYTTIRLAIKCNSVQWLDGGEETPAAVSSKIFAYMQSGDDYLFSHVCSAVDLLEIPEEEGGRWLRKDSVDILLPSIELAEESRDKIESDIRFLAREISSYTTLIGTQKSEVTG